MWNVPLVLAVGDVAVDVEHGVVGVIVVEAERAFGAEVRVVAIEQVADRHAVERGLRRGVRRLVRRVGRASRQ
jgi:hypothetical protein